jgi:hypothetical protein
MLLKEEAMNRFTVIMADGRRWAFDTSMSFDDIAEAWCHALTCNTDFHMLKFTRPDGTVMVLHPQTVGGFDTKVEVLH